MFAADEGADELGCGTPYAVGGAGCLPEFGCEYKRSASVAADVPLDAIALLRLPVGAPTDPRLCAACRSAEDVL